MSDSLDRSTTWDSSIVRSIESFEWRDDDLSTPQACPHVEKTLCIVATWMERAGHAFAYQLQGTVVIDPNFIYDVGTMTVNGIEAKFWVKYELYQAGEMGVQGFGSFISPDTAEFPELAFGGEVVETLVLWNPETGTEEHTTIRKPDRDPPTATSHPVAYQILMDTPQGRPLVLSRADPRIRYEHPKTRELLAWVEFKREREEHYGEDAWECVNMQLTDGYPLCAVYMGTSDVDASHLLELFESKGVSLGVSEA